MSACLSSGFAISPSLWLVVSRVSEDDNLDLMIPLSTSEIDDAVASSNSNSAPCPDGFSFTLLKQFRPVLKFLVYVVIQVFCLGTVDISHLNYAVLSVIPKVKWQFHPSIPPPLPLLITSPNFRLRLLQLVSRRSLTG